MAEDEHADSSRLSSVPERPRARTPSMDLAVLSVLWLGECLFPQGVLSEGEEMLDGDVLLCGLNEKI